MSVNNVTTTKSDFLAHLVTHAALLEKYAAINNDEMVAYYFANFQGANAFIDADFAAHPWLTVPIVTAMITTMQALQAMMTQAQRNNIRAVENGPLPLG